MGTLVKDSKYVFQANRPISFFRCASNRIGALVFINGIRELSSLRANNVSTRLVIELLITWIINTPITSKLKINNPKRVRRNLKTIPEDLTNANGLKCENTLKIPIDVTVAILPENIVSALRVRIREPLGSRIR